VAVIVVLVDDVLECAVDIPSPRVIGAAGIELPVFPDMYPRPSPPAFSLRPRCWQML